MQSSLQNAIYKVLQMLLLGVFMLFGAGAVAQSGTIKGVLTEDTGGSIQPIPFANVIIAGTSIGGTTDFYGNFAFQVEPGTYEVVFSYIGYETDTIKSVQVIAGSTTVLDHVMRSVSVDIQVVEVVHVQDRERETVLLMDRKESTDLVQNIGAQELQKKGASDVAEGVKKVVGMSVVGGRYVYVRGLGDRYNTAYLNGLPLPSPDPDSKVAPLDIFPTNVVGSITVNKAFTPDQYGDFAGGSVDIRTKMATGEPIFQVSLGGGMNTQSTFQDFRTYNGGGTDFWGVDDGSRELPSVLAGTEPFSGDRTLPFDQNFNSLNKAARPDLNFGLFGGDRFKVTEDVHLNVLATVNYKNEYRYRNGYNRMVNAQNATLIDYQFDAYSFNTQSSALATLALELGKRHQVAATTMLANLSSDEHMENHGDHFDYEPNVYARRYTFRQNKVWVNQVYGEHNFGIADRMQVEWALSSNFANSNEPDRRQLVYLYEPGASQNEYQFNVIDRIENQRWFSALAEEELSARTGASYRIIQEEKDGKFNARLTLHAGAQAKRKKRNFGYDVFAYRLEGVGIDYPNGVDLYTPDSYLDATNYLNGVYFIQDVTGPEADHYIRQNIDAAYSTIETDLVPNKLKVLVGARYEIGEQKVIYRMQSDAIPGPFRVAINNTADLLPFASVKYDVTDKQVIRASASKTLSRPGFREMAPFEYTEFFAGSKNIGDPLLKNGMNYNAEVRYEIYPQPGELIAIGAFGKKLYDPIEKVQLASASGQLMSFRNTQEAQVAGLELEVVKNIGGLLGKDSTTWNDFSIGLNATALASQITIGAQQDLEGPSEVLTNDQRPLQGASPYLLNADLSYTRQLGNSVKGVFTLAYNIYGKRVFAAGGNGLGDQYEMPLNTLNLVLRAEVGDKWQLGLKGSNLLNAEYRIEQETPQGNALINSYRTGVGVSFGVSYRILGGS